MSEDKLKSFFLYCSSANVLTEVVKKLKEVMQSEVTLKRLEINGKLFIKAYPNNITSHDEPKSNDYSYDRGNDYTCVTDYELKAPNLNEIDQMVAETPIANLRNYLDYTSGILHSIKEKFRFAGVLYNSADNTCIAISLEKPLYKGYLSQGDITMHSNNKEVLLLFTQNITQLEQDTLEINGKAEPAFRSKTI